jgi:hypothetical protein
VITKNYTTPQDAEQAFYRAFEHADLAEMMAVWAEEDIVCVHPGGGRHTGLVEVRESWRQIFAAGPRLRFRLDNSRVFSGRMLSVHSVYERVTCCRRCAPGKSGSFHEYLSAHGSRLAHAGPSCLPPRARSCAARNAAVYPALMRPYRAPWWLPGGHLQTIYPSLVLRRRPPRYRRERWQTPDGDFIDLDWIAEGVEGAPLLALFHGLEGGSGSHYAAALMRALARRHWHGVVVHFRGCSGEPNLLPRAYHSGDADEIGWILQRLHTLAPTRPLFAAGVSLGGNALLKWLGREHTRARAVIDAAAAISAPMDLMTAGDLLGGGFNRIYGWHFLKTLKPKSLAKLRRFPGLYDGNVVRNAAPCANSTM